MERFGTWHEILMERLSDPEDVIGYLEVSLEKDWQNQHEWLVDMLEKIYAVFRPRLEKLMVGFRA